MNMFAGTAEYYDKYRPGIPGQLVVRLVEVTERDAQAHSLLDLGAGTGKVIEQFLPYFKDVVAVESDPEMMLLAKQRLGTDTPADASVMFLDGNADTVQFPPNWTASLVTICRAFHWMDQPRVLQRLNDVVEQNGTVAIFSDKSFWTQDNPWVNATRSTVQEFLGPERQAGAGETYDKTSPNFKDTLQASPFSIIEQFYVPVRRLWNTAQILGYLYSTSFAAPHLFGDHKTQFEATLARRLQTISPDDRFIEDNEFDVLLGRRPS